ncbi:MAG: alkaline phosphatase family protein [Candidatus Pacearchaeota archaeon]
MKGILVILDGVGDLPNKQLNNQTPLEAAEMPNLDFLANRGELGQMYSVKPGYTPESSEAILSIFGNSLDSATRGQLEARGAGIKLVRGDLALRTNFATIDSLENKNLVDRRTGRTLTTKEAETLAHDLNKIDMPCKFIFKPTIQHRGVLVFKGGFSDNISGNDSHYQKKNDDGKVTLSKALDEDENSHHTANIINEFLEKAYNVLAEHPVNEKRKKKGLMSANYLLFRGQGVESPKVRFYRKWSSVAYMPLEQGFSKVSGMDVLSFKYPKLKNHDVYENLHKGLKKACKFSVKAIKKTFKKSDYIYIHLKETDLPGHDNKPIEKKIMLEYIDKKLFSFLRKFAVKKKVKVVVTGDHSTPCKLKAHSSDLIPVLLYNDSPPKEKHFCESEAKKGSLGLIAGKDLLNKVGFVR